MAFSTSPEPSRPRARLHNFTFSSGGWGHHRVLRCAKAPPPPQAALASASEEEEEDEEMKAVRERLMAHYHVAVDKIERKAADAEVRVASAAADAEVKVSSAAVEAAAAAARPWNLRTRRAVCGAPPPGNDEEGRRSSGRRAEGAASERREFSLTLTPEEAEADLRLMLGDSFSRRRRRRRQTLKSKKLLDTIFPGAWLSEVTADTYKVTEDSSRRP